MLNFDYSEKGLGLVSSPSQNNKTQAITEAVALELRFQFNLKKD